MQMLNKTYRSGVNAKRVPIDYKKQKVIDQNIISIKEGTRKVSDVRSVVFNQLMLTVPDAQVTPYTESEGLAVLSAFFYFYTGYNPHLPTFRSGSRFNPHEHPRLHKSTPALTPRIKSECKSGKLKVSDDVIAAYIVGNGDMEESRMWFQAYLQDWLGMPETFQAYSHPKFKPLLRYDDYRFGELYVSYPGFNAPGNPWYVASLVNEMYGTKVCEIVLEDRLFNPIYYIQTEIHHIFRADLENQENQLFSDSPESLMSQLGKQRVNARSLFLDRTKLTKNCAYKRFTGYRAAFDAFLLCMYTGTHPYRLLNHLGFSMVNSHLKPEEFLERYPIEYNSMGGYKQVIVTTKGVKHPKSVKKQPSFDEEFLGVFLTLCRLVGLNLSVDLHKTYLSVDFTRVCGTRVGASELQWQELTEHPVIQEQIATYYKDATDPLDPKHNCVR